MPKPVISGRQDIGPLWLRVPDALRGTVRIDPSAYERFSYRWDGGASDNWDEVACALDLINFWHGQPMIGSLAKLELFLSRKLSDKRFMQKEFGSWIYVDLHAGPTIVQYVVARRLAQQGSAAWSRIAAGLREWLRALIGWLTLTGCWGPGKTWTKAVAKDGPGARLLVGRGDYSKRTNGVTYCVLAGKRSWDFDDEWKENAFALVLLSDLGFGVRSSKGDIWASQAKFMRAIEDLFGPLDLITSAERQLIVAATRNDLSAIQWTIENLVGDWLPAELVCVVRTERGVSITMYEAQKAPTATIYHSGWDDDGTTYAAGACNGLRGAHGEQIEAGMAEIDLEARTGFCRRTSGPDRVRVDFPLPKGPLVAVIQASHSTGVDARYYRGGVRYVPGALPPSGGVQIPPAAPKPPRRRRWYEFWR